MDRDLENRHGFSQLHDLKLERVREMAIFLGGPRGRQLGGSPILCVYIWDRLSAAICWSSGLARLNSMVDKGNIFALIPNWTMEFNLCLLTWAKECERSSNVKQSCDRDMKF
jgi:hypothetical protein